MEELNLKEMFAYFLANVYVLIVLGVLFAVGGFIYFNYIQVPMYHSSATIILVSEQSNKDTTATDITLNQKLVSTYSEIIKNRKILEQVIYNTRLDTTVKELSDNISVTSVKDTEIIKIEVSNSDNSRAMIIAKEITNIFTKEVNKIYNLQNVTVLSNAQVETEPYNVSLFKQTVLSLIVGVFIGLLILFVIFYFDTSIKTVSDIEDKLGLTVLSTVIYKNGKGGKKKHGNRKRNSSK